MTVRRMMAFALALSALFSSCRLKVQPVATEPTEDLARIVAETTGGLIATDSRVLVRFAEAMIADEDVGDSADAVFAIAPRVRGRAVWADPSTIVFQPNTALPPRRQFHATVDLAAILAEPEKESSFTFAFTTAGREVTGITGGFTTPDETEPDAVQYAGTVEFSEAIGIDDAADALSFAVADRDITLSLEQVSQSEIRFATTTIRRDERRRGWTLTVAGDAASLSQDFVQAGILEAAGRFAPVNVVDLSDSVRPSLRVDFSDDIADGQQLDGLIWTEPAVELDLRRSGRSVYLHGEFKQGQTYTVRVSKGVRSKRGTTTEQETANDVTVTDLNPEMSFLHSGVFLPTTGNRRIHFQTTNLRRVNVEVKKVFENNLGQFLQTEELSSAADRTDQFNDFYVNRVGVTVAEEELEIGETQNQPLVHELDLARLIDPREKGLYLISITFDREDMLYDLEGADNRNYYGEEYYSNPGSHGYIWAHGRIYKPVVVTDIGLVWKMGRTGAEVFATDLVTARPLPGVDVTLRTYQNQVIAQQRTDSSGRARFTAVDQEVFYVTGEKNDQRSTIKANEMAWNVSSFNVGGVEPSEEGLRAYIYTERGVYRPGDTIHLNAILRNEDGSFPDGHPLEVKVTNARGQVHLEDVVTDAVEGVYYIPFQTGETDPTGTWQVELTAGNSTFQHAVRVETIVPNRLRVNIETTPESLDAGDRYVTVDLASSYLFGAPASGLDAELDATIEAREKRVESFPGFVFADRAVDFTSRDTSLYRGGLNRDGETRVRWELPPVDRAPSALSLRLAGRVLEPGGRATRSEVAVDWEPYTHYVGLDIPEFRYGYAQLGGTSEFPVIVVDADGEAASGRTIEYKVYRNSRYWWWEYDSYASFRARYRSDENTELITEGTVRSRSTPATIRFRPDSWGEYLLQATDIRSGHTASFFFRASTWAGAAGGDSQGILSLRTDRDRYAPGDVARISAPTPEVGSLLITVEGRGQVMSSQWIDSDEGETIISIPITEEMIPNAYLTVSLFQPHAQTANDRPVRMYGVVPLMVEDPTTKQELTVVAPDELEPQQEFSVAVETNLGAGNQVTIAVVDEGLLDLTSFDTPDPWASFYAKQRLGVSSYDLFSQVIGAFRGDVFRVFSIGGGEGELGADGQNESERRFEPVALFSGPLTTDADGRVETSFTMPNYMGSVRIMAVAAKGNQYGSVEKAVPVRSEVVVLPTIPRVLGPNESFRLPVSLFSTSGDPGSVEVSIETEGPIQVNDRQLRQIFLSTDESNEVFFNVDTAASVGQGRITITVRSANKVVVLPTPVEVRASSPPIFRTFTEPIEPGRAISLELPTDGVAGSNRAVVTVSTRENVSLEHRLRWLIRYPYGCIEQTVSAAFPQLYLDVFPASQGLEDDVTKNVNATVERLRRFQLPSGGFSYWPGSTTESAWGTNYAGHFLLEADARGYHVPDELLDGWLRYQRSRALTEQDSMMTRVYRLYLLAMADEPAIGPMNLVRENNLDDMTDVQTWLLAAAYAESGLESTGRRILFGAGTDIPEYREFGGTYGSAFRDTAMILDAAVSMNRTSVADDLFEVLSDRMSSDDWYSTQETGYALLAMGKYLQSLRAAGSTRLAGQLVFPDGGILEFDTSDGAFAQDVSQEVYRYSDSGAFTSGASRVQVELADESTVTRAFVTVQWEGTPLFWMEEDIEENLAVDALWYDEEGRTIDPGYIEQGAEFYGRFTVARTRTLNRTIEEVYLDQIIPSGWEIVNPRLWGDGLPGWANRYDPDEAEYLDIRDDRVTWFFDMSSRQSRYTFFMKFQAVVEGSFSLPPTAAGAMYDKNYRAVSRGDRVSVEGR